MADVFISYSQKAPEPTEKLAAELGARGYAYWYDTRLLPNDVFWHVNRGPDQAADFHPASRFAAAFKKPEIVLAALDAV